MYISVLINVNFDKKDIIEEVEQLKKISATYA